MVNISINCSPEQFQSIPFQGLAEQIIHKSGLLTEQITLEITEVLSMETFSRL